ncbi:Transposable element tcb1 transposase [Caligus rogercresseyi]|uniref:Transposable element tcb1 transposase n=1 Tax=Caligus rogercresseyi TaxID=217165 RepID=A0A7T8HEM0_CALRO|nr:Transposable element tcb1 transposase [Caligus rogercresseyi]
MEQTEGHGHRVVVRRAPSCSHHQVAQVPQEDGLRHHKKVGGVRDVQEEGAQAQDDRICTATFVAGLKRSIRPIRDAHPYPPAKAWGPPDSAPAYKAKLVQSWLKKNVPNFWDFNIWPPTAPT